jgi:hypothetical protein
MYFKSNFTVYTKSISRYETTYEPNLLQASFETFLRKPYSMLGIFR